MTVKETLNDLALWMQRRLDSSLKAKSQSGSGYLIDEKTTGWTAVEVPDWEMRQKLEAVQEALKIVDIPEPCPDCDERHEQEAQAADGMRNAAEIAGLQ